MPCAKWEEDSPRGWPPVLAPVLVAEVMGRGWLFLRLVLGLGVSLLGRAISVSRCSGSKRGHGCSKDR